MKKQFQKSMSILLCLTVVLANLLIIGVGADTYTGTESPFDCPPSYAFDARPESKWCTEMGTDGAYLQQELSVGSKAYGYYFCTGKDTNEYPGRNPVAWKISGSVDGENWTVIETVTGDSTLERASMKFYYFYFDQPTKNALVNRFYDVVKPGGYFYIGHAESIPRGETKFEYIKPAIYRRPMK